MATVDQVARVITLLAEEAGDDCPDNVEQRALAFTQMLCGAMQTLGCIDAAAALRTMIGIRRPAARG
jgi:hypothetical protein